MNNLNSIIHMSFSHSPALRLGCMSHQHCSPDLMCHSSEIMASFGWSIKCLRNSFRFIFVSLTWIVNEFTFDFLATGMALLRSMYMIYVPASQHLLQMYLRWILNAYLHLDEFKCIRKKELKENTYHWSIHVGITNSRILHSALWKSLKASRTSLDN